MDPITVEHVLRKSRPCFNKGCTIRGLQEKIRSLHIQGLTSFPL